MVINNIEVKKSTVSRRAQRAYGITSMLVDFQLIHLQNIAIIRDELKNYLALPEEDRKYINPQLMVQNACKILDFIVQKDFESPIADNLFEYDPTESTLTETKKI